MAEGTPAERFAIEHAHYTEDLPFWRALAHEVGSPVLDLGAAAGRVSTALAEDGHDVLAVDNDVAMLGQITRALGTLPQDAGRIETVAADLRSLDLGRAFPLVIMPMNTLQAFHSSADHRAVLRSAHGHVAAGGVFAFDVVMPDLTALEALVGVDLPGEKFAAPGGQTLHHRSRYDAVDTQTGQVTFTTVIDERHFARPAISYTRHHTVHLFSPTELWGLLVESGFVVQAVHGDFAGSPLTDDSERQVYRCGVTA
jgi:SAM-dependent methyltransferase